MTPPCYNRAPYAAGRRHHTGRVVQHGTRETPDSPVVWGIAKPVLRWHPRWYEDRCVTWDGVGIGQPTAKYPAGTPYPMAHGWRCSGCRWLPAKHEGDAA